jgi:hypothetical protein
MALRERVVASGLYESPGFRSFGQGVTLTGSLKIQDETGEHPHGTGLTNSSGYSVLDFELQEPQDPGCDCHCEAQRWRGQELSEDLEFQDRTEVLLSTDKPSISQAKPYAFASWLLMSPEELSLSPRSAFALRTRKTPRCTVLN